MKILIEGPDASGKSVLAKTLSETFSLDYFHFSYEKNDTVYERQKNSTLTFMEASDNYIIDRFLPSEIVYGEVIRQESRVTESEVRRMINALDYVIFCIPSDEAKYIDNFAKMMTIRPELVPDINIMTDVYRRYIDYVMTLTCSIPDDKSKIKIYDINKNQIIL